MKTTREQVEGLQQSLAVITPDVGAWNLRGGL